MLGLDYESRSKALALAVEVSWSRICENGIEALQTERMPCSIRTKSQSHGNI